MARVCRIAYTNLVQASATTIVPSSEETSLPRAALTRQGLGDVLRFKTGWTIVASVNDKISVDIGAGFVAATVAASYYSTGAALATAVQSGLTTTFPSRTWTVTYNVAATDKFRIEATGGNIEISEDATDGGASILADMGYPTGSGAGGYTASATSYQSRHWINADLGSAQAITVAIVHGHNLSASGTVTVQADAASLAAIGLTDVSTPDFSQALSGTGDVRVVFFASQTKQYVRLIFSDVSNSAGYNELAIAYVGTYVTPSTPESWVWTKTHEQLSETFIAIGGANHQVQRPRRAVYSLQWRTNSSADVSLFEALDLAMPAGKSFFISFDATDNPTTSTVYGYLREGLVEQRNDGALYVMSLVFCEALE